MLVRTALDINKLVLSSSHPWRVDEPKLAEMRSVRQLVATATANGTSGTASFLESVKLLANGDGPDRQGLIDLLINANRYGTRGQAESYLLDAVTGQLLNECAARGPLASPSGRPYLVNSAYLAQEAFSRCRYVLGRMAHQGASAP